LGLPLTNKNTARVTVCLAFLGTWLAFSVFVYVIVIVNQLNMLLVPIGSERSFVEQLIGWELGRQNTWAALTIASLVGIFSLIKFLRDYSTAYVRFLLSLMYLGFAMSFAYCVLRLFWSYQTITMYEGLLGKISGAADPIQNFLFNPDGTIRTQGLVVTSSLIGLATTLLFQIFQFGTVEERRPKKEGNSIVYEAYSLLEENTRKKNEEDLRELMEVKGIGPKTSRKLKEAGIENLSKLAASNVEEISKVLGLSAKKALSYIEEAQKLLEKRQS